MRRIKAKESNKDKAGLTSSHHMAAEATVRRMKAFLYEHKGIRNGEDSPDKECTIGPLGFRRQSARDINIIIPTNTRKIANRRTS